MDGLDIEMIALADGEGGGGFVLLSNGETVPIAEYIDFMGESWEPGGNPDDVACIVAGPYRDEWATIEMDHDEDEGVTLH